MRLKHFYKLGPRVRLLSYVSSTGEPLLAANHSALVNISRPTVTTTTTTTTSNGDSPIEYRIDLIRDSLNGVYDKSTKKYLNDQLDVLESVVGNLK